MYKLLDQPTDRPTAKTRSTRPSCSSCEIPLYAATPHLCGSAFTTHKTANMPPRSKRSAAVEEAAPEPAPRRSSRRLGSLPGRRTSARRRKSRCSPRHHEAPARFATGEFVVGVEAQQANPKAKAETKQAGATHAHTAHTHTRARVYERACTERCMHGHTDDAPARPPVCPSVTLSHTRRLPPTNRARTRMVLPPVTGAMEPARRAHRIHEPATGKKLVPG
jgi:hypothetical protein